MRLRSFLAIALLAACSGAPPASAATIVVDGTDDVVADDGVCTLREAVIAANTDTPSGATPGECNAGAGADVIELPAGTYAFAIGGAEEDAAATGDLDLTADVVVAGAGVSATIVDGLFSPAPDRLFHVLGGVVAEIRDLTLQHGLHVRGCANGCSRGGGIQNLGTLTLRRVTLSQNTASERSLNANGAGGGIHNASAATLTLEDCTLIENSTDERGGGIYNEGALVVDRSSFVRNSVTRGFQIGGGGLADEGTSAVLSNSTFSGNTGVSPANLPSAGAIVGGPALSLTHCTLTGNRGSSAGANGILGGTVTFANTILDDGRVSGGALLPACSSVAASSLGGNVETVGSTCGLIHPSDQVNVAEADLALAPLADNGGPTQTHAIGAASVARDAALDANCTETDQRGVLRPDGDGAPGGVCDAGAFEFTTTTSTTTTTLPCQGANPLTSIVTFAKGGSAANNAIVSTEVTGNIIGAPGLGPTADSIPVCAGTDVTTATTDTSGTPTVTKSSAGVSCGAGADCTISAIGAKEKYTVQSANGQDTDTLTFLPQ